MKAKLHSVSVLKVWTIWLLTLLTVLSFSPVRGTWRAENILLSTVRCQPGRCRWTETRLPTLSEHLFLFSALLWLHLLPWLLSFTHTIFVYGQLSSCSLWEDKGWDLLLCSLVNAIPLPINFLSVDFDKQYQFTIPPPGCTRFSFLHISTSIYYLLSC